MTVGKRIATWRKARGLSQKELAALVGVTVAAVYRWEGEGEKGEPAQADMVNPSLDKLEKVVEALGLTMERFYGRLPKVKAAS